MRVQSLDIKAVILTIVLKPILIAHLVFLPFSFYVNDDQSVELKTNDLDDRITIIHVPIAKYRVSSHIRDYSLSWAFDKKFYPITIKEGQTKRYTFCLDEYGLYLFKFDGRYYFNSGESHGLLSNTIEEVSWVASSIRRLKIEYCIYLFIEIVIVLAIIKCKNLFNKKSLYITVLAIWIFFAFTNFFRVATILIFL
jgi:hypothetical protein